MATASTEITFMQTVSDTAKNVLIEVNANFTGSHLTWASALTAGLVKIVDPNGNTHYNNTDVSAPDITSSVKAISGVSSNVYTSTNHGLSTGQPVRYSAATPDNNLTNNNNYYVIVLTASTFKLATTYANAIAGTNIVLNGNGVTETVTYSSGTIALPTDSDNEIIQGLYTTTVTLFSTSATGTQFDRSQNVNYIYDSPDVGFTNSYSIINPIFLKSVDATDYTSDGVTPAMNGTMTLNYPDNLGTYVKDITSASTTLSTSGFYGGSPATHSVDLSNSLTYTFTKAYYSDSTGVLVDYYVIDTVTGRTEINVYSNVSGCDIYCCLKTLEEKVEAAKGTDNYSRIKEKMDRATQLAYLMQKAYECNKSSDVNSYRTEFDRITGCTGDCGDCGDGVTQVVGIGTVPTVTKKKVVTLASNVTSYTFTGLIGKSFTNGDFIPMVDGQDAEFLGGYTLTFNSVTGNLGYGLTVFSGTKIGWRLV